MEPNNDDLIVKLEEAGVKQEEIDLIVNQLNESHGNHVKNGKEILDLTIKQQIIEEDDWIKRAKLAALMISSSFDD